METDENINAIVADTGQEIKLLAATLTAFPAPDQWTQEQQAQAVQFAALLETAQKMIALKSLTGVDWQTEKETFLTNAGKTNSAHTRTGYRTALSRLDTWAVHQGINPLELTPAQADDFIYALRAEGRAPASIRLDTAVCSSFFTFLHRRHADIDNPFRGTKARPAKKAVRETVIPDAKEVKTIIAALSPMEVAAASVMAYRGLRVGALPTLSITGKNFAGHSKGKDIYGELPQAAMKAIDMAGLPLWSPFAVPISYKVENWPNTLAKRIVKATKELYRVGKIRAVYSCHDLRHFYALTQWRKHKDIHRLKELLGHASIQVTENYLKGLGEGE